MPRSALLLIDVINDMDFEGSESLVRLAEPMARRLWTLKRRARVIMIEVVVEVFDREWWARYCEQLETRFGQEEVLARALAMERI